MKDTRQDDPQFDLVLSMYAVLNDVYRREWDPRAASQEQRLCNPQEYEDENDILRLHHLVSPEVWPSHDGWVYSPTWNAPRPADEVLTARLNTSPHPTGERISLANVVHQFDDPVRTVVVLNEVQEWQPLAKDIFERAWQHRLLHRAKDIFAHSLARNLVEAEQARLEVVRLRKQHQESLLDGEYSLDWLDLVEARRLMHWRGLRQHWLEIWSQIDARFRKRLRSQETISAKPANWNALIKPAELYAVSNLLYESLKQWPDDFVPDHFEVVGVWYVLMLSRCGASNDDLNRIRRRPSDGTLRPWSKIVENKCRDYERKAVRRSGSL